MIICSHSNIDIIQGVIGYGDAEGITDWRISNTNTGILNILNSTSANVRLSILENGNVGIGTTNPGSTLDIIGDANITGVFKKNNRDIINDTSNYMLSTSNILVPRILTEVGNGSNYISILNTALNTRVDNTSNYVLSTSNIFTNKWITSTTDATEIYYNDGNVGIGTNDPTNKLHIRNDTTNTTALTIQNNFSSGSITATPTTTGTTGIYTYQVFTYTTETGGAGQTQYTINVPTGGVVCDILIVGGGGGGGNGDGSSYEPGGGGAGGVVYMINKTLQVGTYKVNVAKGGASDQNGFNSSIIDNLNNNIYFDNIMLVGYGGGNGATTSSRTGSNGGSGGGGGNDRTNGGLATQGNTFWNGTSYVAGGFNGGRATAGSRAGGGGGAGEVGSTDGEGFGGDGRQVSITGTATFYAGGGNGFNNPSTTRSDGGGGTLNGGLGFQNGGNALPNTGSGGAGAYGPGGYFGGAGGSGYVVIRYITPITSSVIELIRGTSGDANTDYKIGNYSGDFKIIASTNDVDTEYIRITSSGASIYNPTGSPEWSTVSDRRIKENIEKASYDMCYDNINKLELYRFNYIKELNNINNDLKQLGYIAQEVQDIFPKAVSKQGFNNDNLNIPDMLSIDIAQINYTLYGAVKKLIEMCNDKKGRLKNLEYLLFIDASSRINK